MLEDTNSLDAALINHMYVHVDVILWFNVPVNSYGHVETVS